MEKPENRTTVIKPKNKLLQVDFGEIWQYRDLTILFTFVVQLWIYATRVIYPLSTMSPKMQKIMFINPLTSIVEAFKYGTMGVGAFSWASLSYSFVFMIMLLAVGVVVFNKVQRSFMDTV